MKDPRILRIRKYVLSHKKGKITLKEAAEIANLSSNYFSSLFKKEMGVNFSRYQKFVRIKKALKLLKRTGLSVKEISYDIGYSNVSCFCREFKEVKGITPSSFRKRFRIFHLFQYVTGKIVKIVHVIERFVKKN